MFSPRSLKTLRVFVSRSRHKCSFGLNRRRLLWVFKTSLCWLANDLLHEFAELPSGGDNSYPGFVEISPNRAIVSWYSSHERDANGKAITAIYMADLEIVE